MKNDRLIVRIGSHYIPWDAAALIVLGIVAFGSGIIFEPKDVILIDEVDQSLVGDQSKAIETTGGSWRLWPFTFTRSRSRKTVQPTITDAKSSDAENAASHSNIDMNYNQTVVKPEVSKRMVRTIAPTSEELVSLNLKDGSNTVTFTFSTSMLGMQKVSSLQLLL